MANDLTGDPLIIDTAHATNVVVPGDTFVYAIRWSGATTAGHTAELRVKGTARTLWLASATGNGDDTFDVVRLKTPGDCIVPTLASGTLYIYRGPER